MIDRIRSFLNRLPLISQITLPLAIGLIASFVCLLVFAAIAEDVAERDDITIIDLELANELHRQATPQSIDFYRVISFVGMEGIVVIGGLVGGYFIFRRQWLSLEIWAITLIGGYLLNVLIKTLFARPRPTFADPIAVLQSYSFPSGHAMLSLITFGMLAYFLRKRLKTRHIRMIAVFGVMLLVVLIGISRMALGVHYLSDVIAGYAAGGVWLISCIIAAQRFERKKHNADMGERTPE